MLTRVVLTVAYLLGLLLTWIASLCFVLAWGIGFGLIVYTLCLSVVFILRGVGVIP